MKRCEKSEKKSSNVSTLMSAEMVAIECAVVVVVAALLNGGRVRHDRSDDLLNGLSLSRASCAVMCST